LSILGAAVRAASRSFESPERPLSASTLAAEFGGDVASGMSVTEHSSLGIVAVWRSVNLIAGAVASLPFHVFRSSDKGRITSLDAVEDPHPDLTPYELRELQMVHLLLWGNSFSWILRDGRQLPRWVVPIHPSLVRVERVAVPAGPMFPTGTRPRYWVRDEKAGVESAHFGGDILHIPALGTDGVAGLSPIRTARQTLGLAQVAEAYGAQLFGRGTRIDGVLSADEPVSKDEAAQIQQRWMNAHSGLENAYRIPVLGGGLKFEPVAIPPDDAQFIECVVPGTLFTMADGTRRAVEDIRPGDRVASWDDDGKLCGGTVRAVGAPRRKALVRVRTARGRELVASADHPLLARRRMRTRGGRYDSTPPAWVQAASLEPGNYVRVALGAAEPSGNGAISCDQAYFLGAMAGDGHIRSGSCGFTSFDVGVTVRMRQALRAMGGDLHETQPGQFSVVTGGRGRAGSATRRLLTESGLVGTHSCSKFVPETVVAAGSVAWRGFLSGLIDADGCVHDPSSETQQPGLSMTSTSLALLEGCQHLLALLGVQSAIYDREGSGRREVMGVMCDARRSWQLHITGVMMLRRAAIELDLSHTAKRDRLAMALGQAPSRYRPDNWEYDRVVEVENMPDGDTIGVEVDECHTHVTAGLVTHNSRQFSISEIARMFGLPPHLLADVQKSTSWGQGIEQQQIALIQYTLRPWLSRIEARWNRDVVSALRRSAYAEFVVDGLLRGDIKSRHEALGRSIGAPWMTVNEGRKLENLEPVDGGDEVLQPLNMASGDDDVSPPAETPPPVEEEVSDDDETEG